MEKVIIQKWESAIIFLGAFTLFRPGVWLDRIAEEYTDRPGTEIAKKMQAGTSLLITVSGPNFDHPDIATSLVWPFYWLASRATETPSWLRSASGCDQ